MSNESKEFVSITISKSQIVGDFEKDGKKSVVILAPNGYTFPRPKDQVKQSQSNNEKMYFSIPADWEVEMRKNIRVDGVPDDAPVEEKFTYESIHVSAGELHDLFRGEKLQISNKQLLSIFKAKDEREYAKIMAPNGYTFVLSKEKVHHMKNDENHLVIDIMKSAAIKMQHSIRIDGVPEDAPNDQKYVSEEINVSADELMDMFHHPEFHRSDENSDFVNISISKKQTVDYFKAKDSGKEYVRILAPNGYTFIRPQEQVKVSSYNENRLYFALGKDMEIKLQKNVKAEEKSGEFSDGEYITQEITVTAQQLKDIFQHKQIEEGLKDDDLSQEEAELAEQLKEIREKEEKEEAKEETPQKPKRNRPKR
jgi:hypothetical protein